MVVIARGKGGAYIVAELDGSVFQEQIAQFRVIPYFARKDIELDETILDWIDISSESLEKLRNQLPRDESSPDFNFDNVSMKQKQEKKTFEENAENGISPDSDEIEVEDSIFLSILLQR
jgi:hypothetical protein